MDTKNIVGWLAGLVLVTGGCGGLPLEVGVEEEAMTGVGAVGVTGGEHNVPPDTACQRLGTAEDCARSCSCAWDPVATQCYYRGPCIKQPIHEPGYGAAASTQSAVEEAGGEQSIPPDTACARLNEEICRMTCSCRWDPVAERCYFGGLCIKRPM